MPIYEFECRSCKARFERLVAIGTAAAACPECGAEDARRVYSAQAAAFKLVNTPGATRKQERANASLRESAKARFKEARRRARERAGGGGS